jgi:membrane protein implicated in regulation of membrane protease activity
MMRRASGAFSAYVLLQLPDIILAGLVLFVLHRWAALSAEWATGLFVVWVVKDVAMYSLVRSAFAPLRTGPEAFVGARGVAEEALAPVGYVRCDGELWLAERFGLSGEEDKACDAHTGR